MRPVLWVCEKLRQESLHGGDLGLGDDSEVADTLVGRSGLDLLRCLVPAGFPESVKFEGVDQL